jgi:hypothetical protein
MFRKLKYPYLLLFAFISHSSHLQALPTTNSGQAYINECAAAGVPIPPDWGSSKWKFKSKIDNPVISKSSTAHVYYYDSASPKGICIALPRVSSSGTVTLLGIICQGNDTSKACFWDNSTFTLPSLTTPKPLADFTGGAGLAGKTGGVCTECHAGENVFNILPLTATDFSSTGISTKPNDYVAPLVAKEWPQNSTPNTVEGACNVCHSKSVFGRLPQLSTDVEGFCDTMLQHTFDNGDMPPAGSPAGDYAGHYAALFAACKLPPPTTPPTPVPVDLNPTQIWQVAFY